MGANRDRNSRVTFVYSNLYQIYKQEQDSPAQPDIKEKKPEAKKFLPSQTKAVIKVGDRRVVESYNPSVIAVKRPDHSSATQNQGDAIQSLKSNLEQLQDLHSRLRFMLKELEELMS